MDSLIDTQRGGHSTPPPTPPSLSFLWCYKPWLTLQPGEELKMLNKLHRRLLLLRTPVHLPTTIPDTRSRAPPVRVLVQQGRFWVSCRKCLASVLEEQQQQLRVACSKPLFIPSSVESKLFDGRYCFCPSTGAAVFTKPPAVRPASHPHPPIIHRASCKFSSPFPLPPSCVVIE